jgi:hypothetical protein
MIVFVIEICARVSFLEIRRTGKEKYCRYGVMEQGILQEVGGMESSD